jgi:hypothetical protein
MLAVRIDVNSERGFVRAAVVPDDRSGLLRDPELCRHRVDGLERACATAGIRMMCDDGLEIGGNSHGYGTWRNLRRDHRRYPRSNCKPSCDVHVFWVKESFLRKRDT